ncbi:MAG TPA: DUF4340 domain-containing protein [Methylomirabilota bacterium]|nr:DUF4340 domain-containing protein [Methylomirabilota bacterium]
MATPTLRRALWMGAAVLAAGVVIALAAHGRRADPGLVRFEAAGVMIEFPPELITHVVVTRGERQWRFTRTNAQGWVSAPDTLPLGEDTATRLESGLRFLHVSAPQRVMARSELAGTPLAEFGLDPPRYSVSVQSSARGSFTIEFGAVNPQGLAQYARVKGRNEILLLPSFVGEPWEAVIQVR